MQITLSTAPASESWGKNAILSFNQDVYKRQALDVVPQLSADPKLFIITSSMILFSIVGVEWLYKGLEQYLSLIHI